MNHLDIQKISSHSHGGHGWMMIACCIPMLVIAIALAQPALSVLASSSSR